MREHGAPLADRAIQLVKEYMEDGQNWSEYQFQTWRVPRTTDVAVRVTLGSEIFDFLVTNGVDADDCVEDGGGEYFKTWPPRTSQGDGILASRYVV